MNRLISFFFLILVASAHAQDDLRPALENTYNTWRNSIIQKDVTTWQRITADHRRIEIKNRILSEKRAFPAAVFQLPGLPPSIQSLKFLEVKQSGPTAKAAYFGKLDFGTGGKLTENLLILSFTRGATGWLYDSANAISLAALPEVRKELSTGELKYLKEIPEAQPTGTPPPVPVEIRPAKYIAKVYVFCPGREVQVQVNKISRHHFTNTKEAEIVLGGALDGLNEIQYTTKRLEGSTAKEAMTIRVYLMSEIPGVQPIKAFEYQVAENALANPFGSGNFTIDPATAAKLIAR